MSVDGEEKQLDEIAKLLAILVSRSQSLQETVAELDAAGFRQARIAELLGTTPGYVNVALKRSRIARTAQKKGRVQQ